MANETCRHWRDHGTISWHWEREEALVNYMADRIEDYPLVFDFGCGNGNLISTLHQKHPGKKFVGIDFQTADAVSYFKREYGRVPNSVTLVDADLEHMPVPGSSAGYGITAFTLEYNTGRPVAESIAETVRPNGKLFWACHSPAMAPFLAKALNNEEKFGPACRELEKWTPEALDASRRALSSKGLIQTMRGDYVDTRRLYVANFAEFEKSDTLINPQPDIVVVHNGKVLSGKGVAGAADRK